MQVDADWLFQKGRIMYGRLTESGLDAFSHFIYRVYRKNYLRIGVELTDRHLELIQQSNCAYIHSAFVYLACLERSSQSSPVIVGAYGIVPGQGEGKDRGPFPVEDSLGFDTADYCRLHNIRPAGIYNIWRAAGDQAAYRQVMNHSDQFNRIMLELHRLTCAHFRSDESNLVTGFSYEPAWRLDHRAGYPWQKCGPVKQTALGVPSFAMAFTVAEQKKILKEKQPDLYDLYYG